MSRGRRRHRGSGLVPPAWVHIACVLCGVSICSSAMQVPSAFAEGYERAAALDPALAHLYANHLRIGDPDADAVTADLAELPADEAQRFLRAGIELDEDVLRQAPESLQELIREAATLPAWYDRETAQRGCRAFLRNSDALLSAYIGGAMVEGFSTLIARSYAVPGHAPDDAVRWLKQELRQLLDTFLPRGIEPSGDGWQATLRFRMANARARRLLGASEGWPPDDWGVPVSTAHVSLWAAARSARLLEFLPLLGVDLESRDREGIMTVLSCAAHVMGVPGALLFDNQEEGLRLFRVAAASEPPPDAGRGRHGEPHRHERARGDRDRRNEGADEPGAVRLPHLPRADRRRDRRQVAFPAETGVVAAALVAGPRADCAGPPPLLPRRGQGA